MFENGIISYGAYLLRHHLPRESIRQMLGQGGGRGSRTVAGYDEDTTSVPARPPASLDGTNKKCAKETAKALLEDAAHGRLPAPAKGAEALDALLRERVPDRAEYGGWRRLDERER